MHYRQSTSMTTIPLQTWMTGHSVGSGDIVDTLLVLTTSIIGFAILRPGHLPIHILWFVLSAIESDPPTKSKEVLDDRRVEYIAIETPIGDADPDCIFAVRHLVAYNWAKFDQCVASLSALRGVIVGCASRKGVALFMKVVEQHIPQLKASGKLKYAVRLGDYDKGVKWEEYISNSDDKLAVGEYLSTHRIMPFCFYLLSRSCRSPRAHRRAVETVQFVYKRQ